MWYKVASADLLSCSLRLQQCSGAAATGQGKLIMHIVTQLCSSGCHLWSQRLGMVGGSTALTLANARKQGFLPFFCPTAARCLTLTRIVQRECCFSDGFKRCPHSTRGTGEVARLPGNSNFPLFITMSPINMNSTFLCFNG